MISFKELFIICWCFLNSGELMMATLGKRILSALAENEMTRKELANKLEVSVMTISNLINDKNKKKPNVLDIANALGVDPNWLATGQEISQLVVGSGVITNNSGNGDAYITHNNPPAIPEDNPQPNRQNLNDLSAIKSQLVRIEKQLDKLYTEQQQIREQMTNQVNKLIDKVLKG